MEALTVLQQLNELKSTCTSDKEVIDLYETLIDDALIRFEGDVDLAIKDEWFDSMNHNPQVGDL